jgi:hypothetical protein
MAYPSTRTFKDVIVTAYMADVSTASSAFAAVPRGCRGKIIEMGSTIYAAITSADAAITSKISGTAVTGGAWTIANSGAAAGDVDYAEPTAANVVAEYDKIEFISDGASSTTAPAMFYAVIRTY